MGSKEKHWVRDLDGEQWLLKFARVKDGKVRGEDWAECVVHALAALCGVPTACVQPAICDGRRAILSHAVQSHDERLEHGNELLARQNAAYEKSERRENVGYTVAAVKQALEDISAPNQVTRRWGAFGTWTAYVLLDAWVAGRDRHHENWAVARGPSHARLAPSFDHGNALGFAEQEAALLALTEPSKRRRWCERGTSPHFAGQPSLVTVACEALRLGEPEAAAYWTERLRDVRGDDIHAVLSALPEEVMSPLRRTFVENVLHTNRERIFHAFGT